MIRTLQSRRRLLLGALSVPLVAPLAGCVVAPYGTYYRPSSSAPGASFRRAWCQGQAGPTTQIELPLGDGLTLSARAERDYIERDRPELPLRVVLTVPATVSVRFASNRLQIVELGSGRPIAAPMTVRAQGRATVAADAWVEPARLRPAGAPGAASDADAPYGRAGIRVSTVARFAPEAIALTGPAVAFDGAVTPFPTIELRRPASARSPRDYRSAAEQAALLARAEACRRDTPQLACTNIVDYGANRGFAVDAGPLHWQGRWYRFERRNGEAILNGEMSLVVREPRRWRFASNTLTLRDLADGSMQTLSFAQFDIAFVDGIELDTPIHAERNERRAETRIQVEARLPAGVPDFELRIPALMVGANRVEIAPIRFDKRSLDGGIEPFNC